jgi:hypothetical protein
VSGDTYRLSEAARERIRSRVKEQIARQPPPGQKSIDEVGALIAAIRIRRAREAVAARRERERDAAADADRDAPE